ncbi:MAG: VanZ family protein [Actinomycetota bacterium]
MERRATQWDGPLLSAVLTAAAVGTTFLTIWYSLGHAPPSVGTDEDLHTVAYLANTLAILLAVGWRPVARRWRSHAWTLVIAAAMLGLGALMELAQRYVGRDMDPRDWYADALGVGLAVAAYVVIRAVTSRVAGPAGPDRASSGARPPLP